MTTDHPTTTDPATSRTHRRHRLSVRQRLTVTVAVAVSAALVAVGFTLFFVESRRIDRSIDVALTQELGEFRALQAEDDPETGSPFAGAERLLTVFLQRNLPDANEDLYAFGPTGGPSYQGEGDPVLQGSPQFRAAVDALRTTGGTRSVEVSGTRYRIAVQPINDERGASAFVVTHDVTASQAELRELMLTYALLAAVSVLIVAAAASFIAGRLLRPLRRLSDTARGISDGDLGGRIEVTGRDDLTELQVTFNEMLDRVEAAFAAQRALLDDAGHELRTPLTVLRGHLEVLDVRDPDDVASTRVLLLDEIDRMARLVNDLLMLAKSRRPDFVRLDEVDVAMITHGALDRARGLGDRAWTLDEAAEVSAPLDAQRLTQALLQLCDNAVRHTEPGEVVALGSRVESGRLTWWVRDTGAGVDPAVRDTVFDRFAQGGRDTTDEDTGFGLGLSIVRAIAVAHGGEVRLVEGDPDAPRPGATFVIDLPHEGAR